jgi:hypothetical protein
MSTQETALALDALIGSVPGVDVVYRSRSRAAEAVATVRNALSSTDRVEPLALVSEQRDGLAVSVTIGVEPGAGAVETVRAVYGAVQAWLRRQEFDVSGVSVTVAHVAERSEADASPAD